MPHNLKYWVWLSSIPGMGAKRSQQLMDMFGSPENIWRASEKELQSVNSVPGTVISRLRDKKFREDVEMHLESIYRNNIKVVHLEHQDYPAYLKNIYDPPLVLYTKGSLRNDKMVAVVGSRKATPYGLDTAERISCELSRRGITVVSGMARGVDSYAHRGALTAGGRTVAVLGCGPDIVYPPENGEIMEKIVDSGAVISEYLPGTSPLPQNFPARNRIISGMSYGVVIIEANEKSGSLITANFALEQGREVFAVPGNVTSNNSKGTNKLIKDGAKMVTDVEDILEELKFFEIHINNDSINTVKKAEPDSRYINLSAEEKKIVKCLEYEPLHIDLLEAKSGLSMCEINAILVMLELQGVVKQLPGKVFQLNA